MASRKLLRLSSGVAKRRDAPDVRERVDQERAVVEQHGGDEEYPRRTRPSRR